MKKDRIRLNGLQFGIVDRLYEHLEEKPRLLQKMYERKQRLQKPDRPGLIVEPATLVFNWQAEITKFCPGLKMPDYTGQGRLKDEGIAYEYLDGRTRKRQEKVENFQNSGHIRVFLISTKAGGTGLNLTEADYVFIVDPWWNPAVENQAVDRSHRIGQTKHVMAYRLICRDSIEEKILALQQKKQSIADSIVSVDEEKKSFDLDEVRQLFA